MPVSKVVSSVVLAIFLSGSAGVAQQLGGTALPAEFPPTSYKGKQYVDSAGCVYIRAGVAGNVTWVPRVTRSRQPICGMQPTFAKAAEPKPQPAQVAQAPAPKPEPKPAAKPEPKAKPAPKPVAVAAARPAPKPAASAPMQTVASVRTPPRVLNPAPKRVAPAPLPAAAAGLGCSQFGASGRFMLGDDVRCGPQAEYPITYGDTGRNGMGAAAVSPSVTVATASGAVVPRHVYEQQVEATRGVAVPKGYRPVWKDDRLNPNRARGTAAGQAGMDLIWTQTLPRQLIDRRSGRNVTRDYPGLTYPNTDLSVAVSPRVKPARASTKGQVAAGQRFVQVGTFGVPANAQRSAARLQQAGLPVQTLRYAKGGKSYQIVMAGPFGSAEQLSAALSTARQAGFRDAFAR